MPTDFQQTTEDRTSMHDTGSAYFGVNVLFIVTQIFWILLRDLILLQTFHFRLEGHLFDESIWCFVHVSLGFITLLLFLSQFNFDISQSSLY
jgi:hypothetical protein